MKAVVLTLSGKNKNICLAVYCEAKNKIYRLVSDENGGEMPYFFRNTLQLLDLIEFYPKSFITNGPQKENILIDTNSVKKIGRYSGNIKDIYNSLYLNDPRNGKIFSTNYCRLSKADCLKHSLEICYVSNLVIHKVTKYNGEPTGKAEFDFCGIHHKNYSVTDYDFDIRKKSFNEWKVGNAYIVVSIPSKNYTFNGNDMGYYKFVAAIFSD